MLLTPIWTCRNCLETGMTPRLVPVCQRCGIYGWSPQSKEDCSSLPILGAKRGGTPFLAATGSRRRDRHLKTVCGPFLKPRGSKREPTSATAVEIGAQRDWGNVLETPKLYKQNNIGAPRALQKRRGTFFSPMWYAQGRTWRREPVSGSWSAHQRPSEYKCPRYRREPSDRFVIFWIESTDHKCFKVL